jgi:Bifunctional DNA primase/polymerase, N-terminal/Primase C terminal 1 (PriCT-1)
MAWWQSCPTANIGTPTGTFSGRVVLDVDPRHGGGESYVKLQQQYGEIPATLTSRTGGGGLHLVFGSKDPRIRNSAGKLGPGLDIRGEGGYIVVPPSVHATGKCYEWIDPATPIAELPARLASLLLEPDRPTPATSANGCISEGQRNSTLVSLAGTMRKRGMSPGAIEAALLAENTDHCTPPLPELEVRRIAKSVGKYPPGQVMGNGQRPDIEEEDEPEEPKEPLAISVFPEIAWRGIFQTYREAMAGTSEASDVTRFISLWVAAAVRLQRKIKLWNGSWLFPNVYLVLFGDTGDRKTTGTRGFLDLIPDADLSRVLRGAGSGEGIADWLKKCEEGATQISTCLYLEELSELTTRAKWDGSTLKTFLTSVYDCPPRHEVKYRKNPIDLREPIVSLLACTTPALFWQHMYDVDLTGGFGNRLLYLTGRVGDPIPRPARPDYSQLRKVHEALNALAQIPASEGQLSGLAGDTWDTFYLDWRRQDLEASLAAMTKRVPDYCLKLALVYAALEETLPALTAEQIQAATAVGRYAVACTEQLLGHRMRESRQGGCEGAVLRALTGAHRPLPAYKVQELIGGRFTAEDTNRALTALERTGAVIEAGKNIRGKPLYLKRRQVQDST